MVRRSVTIDEDLESINFDDDISEVNLDDNYVNMLSANEDDGVLIYNEKKYAVGLIWLTLSELDGHDSVYKKAKTIEADFYCTRTFISQSGFGSLKKNHRVGMPSAAVLAADTLIGEWHAVFRADNGWYYVAVHSDSIAPDGDKFFTDETECYNHFIQQSKKFKWPKTYVPTAWNVPKNDGEISLEQIFDAPIMASLKPANLDALFAGKANKNITILVGAIFIVFIIMSISSQAFFSAFLPTKEDINYAPLNTTSNLMSPPKLMEEGENPVENLLNRTKVINTSAVISNCLNTFDSLMVSMPGWNLTTMRCRGSFADATWQRTTGTLQTLRNNIDQFPFDVIKTYSANGDFIASSVMKFSDNQQRPLTLLNREDAIVILNGRFSNVADLNVVDIPAEDIMQQNTSESLAQLNKNIVLTVKNLPSLRISMKTDIAPTELLNSFNIEGLTFNLIEWDIMGGEWRYDMNIYLYPENFNN